MNDESNANPYLGRDLNASLNFEIDSVEDGHVTGHFDVHDGVRQPYGIVHGGAYAALAETLASVGTYAAVAPEGKVAMGMANNTQFLRSVSEGTVKAEAVAIQRGRTTWVWDVTLTDSDERVCAVCRMTIAVRERRA